MHNSILRYSFIHNFNVKLEFKINVNNITNSEKTEIEKKENNNKQTNKF